MMLLLWGVAFGLHSLPTEFSSPDRRMWLIALLIQSIPYTAAVLVSLASALNLRRHCWSAGRRIPRQQRDQAPLGPEARHLKLAHATSCQPAPRAASSASWAFGCRPL